MKIFTLISHVNGQLSEVSADRRRRQLVVTIPTGTALARNMHQASRLAAEALGPDLERASRTGSKWALYVSVGSFAATFGRFPEGPASPQLTGPPARSSEPIARIHSEWERNDGSPLGALDAALKIVEIYAERRPEGAAA